jgi:hypothetical protein
VKFIIVVLYCLTSFSAATIAATLYSNNGYDYAVSIPDGFPVEYDEPPAPDHGFGVALGGGRHIVVFADYDALDDGSALAALRRELSYEYWPPKAVLHQVRIVGLPAASARAVLRHRQLARIIAFRAYDGHAAMLYHFHLDTDTAHAAHDCGVFRAILRGFTLRP